MACAIARDVTEHSIINTDSINACTMRQNEK